MKREIKFRYRVKLKDKKIYTRIIYINELERAIYKELQELRTEVVSRDEFTGLKDKNSKEIFENDIVKTNIGTGIVDYSYRWGCWWVRGQKGLGEFLNVEVINK